MNLNLTANKIATLRLPKGKSDYIWFDQFVPGFGIRVRASGSSSWIKDATGHHRRGHGDPAWTSQADRGRTSCQGSTGR